MDRKYYVLCDSNCKFESMTKEQILTAITQAVSEGTIGDIDTGFITTIKTVNGTPLKFFVGQQSEYEALTDDEKQNLFALITNDTTKEGIESAIEEFQRKCDGLQTELSKFEGDLIDGSFVVKEASTLSAKEYTIEKPADTIEYELAEKIFKAGKTYIIVVKAAAYSTCCLRIPTEYEFTGANGNYTSFASALPSDMSVRIFFYESGKQVLVIGEGVSYYERAATLYVREFDI